MGTLDTEVIHGSLDRLTDDHWKHLLNGLACVCHATGIRLSDSCAPREASQERVTEHHRHHLILYPLHKVLVYTLVPSEE